MTIEESQDRLVQLLRDSGFNFAHPNPALAWEVFKQFSAEPVECDDDYLFFEAADGDKKHGWGGYFDFVREYRMPLPGDDAATWYEQLTAHFTNELPDELRIQPVSLHSPHFPDRDSFFRAVEQLPAFRKGLAFPRWAFEVRLDGV
ncbi:MAG: hypothetical protein L0Z62_31480 [Gemmataceae bacterium]|nr:hypothetical protein [Gemmataceae bacterium]